MISSELSHTNTPSALASDHVILLLQAADDEDRSRPWLSL